VLENKKESGKSGRGEKPWRILVVDDKREIHDFYKDILCRDRFDINILDFIDDSTPPPVVISPYRMEHAHSGEEGVRAVVKALEEGDPYALILMDVRMPPGYDGIKAVEKIQKIDKLFKVILISAYSDYTLSEIREQIGVNFDFLSKPVNSAELLQLAALHVEQWDMVKRLEEAHHSLLHSNQKLESIISGIPDGLLILDEGRVIEQANPAIESMTGYSASELEGMSVDLLLQQETCEKENVLIDQHLKHRDGSTVPIKLMSGSITSPVIGAMEGESHEKVLILHDVSAMLRAESAKLANKAKDEFLASMSHELRTPLTTIIGNSEMLAGTLLSQDQKQMLQSVETSGRNLLSLINDILDISKIEAGKIELDEVEFELGLILNEVALMFSAQVEDKGIYFNVENEIGEGLLKGDDRRIVQILINLLGNAMKFTDEGGVVLTVSADPSKAEIHFTVKDSGIGMSDDVLDRLFQPFEQADRSISRRFGGTGLGLHISWSLAELMAGAINVESEEGVGSAFTLKLPYRPLKSRAQRNSSSSESAPQSTVLSGTILLAEDTPELQLLVSRILQSMGEIQVTVACNGKEALDKVLAGDFDLVLMDMQMPIMDGIEATKELRRQGRELPIVALTANVMPRHREQFAEAGCDGLIAKPINKQELRKLLQQHLSTSAESSE
jgi:PAS domain S-box-containing protein